ncbi:unnamed protein product [Acanthosepion pharaonis]|uniref:Uncharacterized protein n=1 Tax=Acanthosepion pharaonis TaxID=158019 RepID=A0A812C692_ACAPH|nr:unnamed protein product [Sepia pharaonis]
MTKHQKLRQCHKNSKWQGGVISTHQQLRKDYNNTLNICPRLSFSFAFSLYIFLSLVYSLAFFLSCLDPFAAPSFSHYVSHSISHSLFISLYFLSFLCTYLLQSSSCYMSLFASLCYFLLTSRLFLSLFSSQCLHYSKSSFVRVLPICLFSSFFKVWFLQFYLSFSQLNLSSAANRNNTFNSHPIFLASIFFSFFRSFLFIFLPAHTFPSPFIPISVLFIRFLYSSWLSLLLLHFSLPLSLSLSLSHPYILPISPLSSSSLSLFSLFFPHTFMFFLIFFISSFSLW